MIAHERRPVLGGSSSPAAIIRLIRPVLPDSAGRDLDAKLERELSGHSHLATRRVLARHTGYQFAYFPWQRRPARSRLPAPEQLEALAMPADQGLWLNDHQSIFPLEQPRPEHKAQPSSVGQRSRPGFVLSVERKLFSQKQVLGNQRGPEPECRPHEKCEVRTETEKQGRNDRFRSPHGSRSLQP